MEALYRTLRDIMNNTKPFGGKILICAGDFRQNFAVIPHANRGAIIDASLKRSLLCKHFVIQEI